MTSFNGKPIIETKLFGTFTKTSCHFKIEIRYSLGSNDFLLVFLSKLYAVRNSSCSLNYLINDIITDRAIFETNDINNTVRFYCIFCCQLFVQ